MTILDNPRAVVGDNRAPDHARQVTEALQRDYAALEDSVAAALDQARELPQEINDDETMGLFARVIKHLRDAAARAEAYRVAEVEPHLRGQQAVNGFFFALIEKCTRRDRKNKPGAADLLQARLDDYNQRKLRAEQERRRKEAEERAKIERAAREEALRREREAEEARLAAARARKPENIETKRAAAVDAGARPRAAGIDAQLAAEAAQGAHVDTLSKPADLVRTRVEQGPLVTMAQEFYAEIEDDSLLDKAKLWPFIGLEAKEKALRAWARTTGHSQQMAGAAIGKRAKSVVR
jgi:hypothetical protein